MGKKRKSTEQRAISLSRVPPTSISRPVLMPGLSMGDTLWYRRRVSAPVRCAACNKLKDSRAMYEYGLADARRPDRITWDGKVYCNLDCLPDDTESIRGEKEHSRIRSKTLSEVEDQARVHRVRLASRYLELGRNAAALAREEGVSRERIRQQLQKAGVRLPRSG